HRRALQPHLVRAEIPPRLRQGEELRRLVDRVGQPRRRPDREGRAGERMTEALQETLDLFAGSDVETRRMLLLDYANGLPELPERYRALMEHGLGRVHECQSPVFLYPEVEDGAVRLHAYVPPESPTVRGVVSLLAQTLDGASPEAVAAVPE